MSKKLKLPEPPTKSDLRFGLFNGSDGKVFFEDTSSEYREGGVEFCVDRTGLGMAFNFDEMTQDSFLFTLEELEYFVSLARFAKENSFDAGMNEASGE